LTLRGTGPRCGSALEELHAIQDGAILIRDGILVEVGPSRRVENLAEARDAIEINAAGRVVMPGFVDAHTHLAFPPAGVDAPDRAGVARALRTVTRHRLEVRARAYLESMARHGTTTVEVTTGCGLDTGAESKLLRMLSTLRSDPIDLIPSFLFRLPEGLNGEAMHTTEWMVGEMLPKIQRRGGTRFAGLEWDCDPALLACFDRYLEAGRQLGFQRKIHATGSRPAAALALAVQHEVTVVEHLEHATASQARLLGETGIMTVLMPAGGDGRMAPARALIDAGVAVALGSNFNPHNTPALNMQTVVAMACDRLGMSIAEAICAATINGAHALGCADTVGSLEPGKSADLVILNAGDYRCLEHSIGTNLVHLTMKRGKFIYKEGDVAALPNDEFV
jgi:imidazolonepropionase